MARAVIKFGGADLASGSKIREAARKILRSKYDEVVVVVSAMKGMTDHLIGTISEIGGVSDQDYAEIVSMGERISARIFCSALRSLGADAIYLEPSDEEWPIITNSDFKNAVPNMEETCRRVKRYIEPLLGEKIVVVCGFLGRDPEGRITTLGRGGSDTTAMILANCLRADEVVLVKETEGVMSADPKIIGDARPLSRLDIHEMFALSYGGAKIIKAEALKYKLPDQRLRVVSFSSDDLSGGTEITGVFNSSSIEVSAKRGLSAVSVICDIEPAVISRVIKTFSDRPLFGISTGRVSLTVFTSSDDLTDLLRSLHGLKECRALSCRGNVGLITLTHPDFIDSPGWISKISAALASKRINIIEVTTSKSTINIFIDDGKVEEAIRAVRDVIGA